MNFFKKIFYTFNYFCIKSLFFIIAQQSASMRTVNAKILAYILYYTPKLFKRRKQIVEKNLQHCFAKQLSTKQLSQAVKASIWHAMRSILERAWLWTVKPEKFLQQIDIKGYEFIDWQKPAIFVGVHNCGLELAPQAIIFESCILKDTEATQWAAVFMDTKTSAMRNFIYNSRQKVTSNLIAKQAGIKPVIEHFKTQQSLGKPAFFNLFCDMDFGLKNSLFIPFFGQSACTSSSLPRVLHMLRQQLKTEVSVYTVHALYDEITKRYGVIISQPWQNFAQSIDEANLYEDLKKFNSFIEDVVLQDIPQYWWLHRRFKTQLDTDSQNIYQK
jgi:KDO2-lipid IV(A) lauroyltransferase